MHKIDEHSLLYGKENLEKLVSYDSDIFVAMSGLDETIGQTVHARFHYKVADIVWGARFVDIITLLEDGTRKIDYRVFHDIERV